MNDWRKALLGSMGLPTTPQNLQFLGTWQRWEGGHTANTAKFNWLNTTHGQGPAINSVGVKRFGSFGEGIKNTAETLMNGRYQDILDGLASGDPYTKDVSRGLQVWVSGRPNGNPAYAAKVLGNPAPPPKQQRVKAAGVKAHAKVRALTSTEAVSPNPQWDRAMRMIFEDDPDMADIMAGMDDRQARVGKFVSPGGSIQPVDDDPEAAPAVNKLTRIVGTQIGKPYVFGSGPGTDSYDCSDLVQWAYKQIGVSIPRVTYDQIKAGRSVKGQPLKPGDLIFPHSGHVVMYVGGGKVIAAPYTGTVVQYQPVSKFANPLEVRRIL